MKEFDFGELSKFEKDMLDKAQKFERGKDAKKFLRNERNKLKKITQRLSKKRVEEKTGHLFKHIKGGKPYHHKATDAMTVRVYSSSPHMHLVENGHRMVNHDGKEVGHVDGKHIFEDASRAYGPKFYANVQNFIDDMLDKGL